MVAFFGTAVFTYIIGFEDIVEKKEAILDNETNRIAVKDAEKVWYVTAPVEGKAIELNQIHDKVFAEERLGKGIAIIPSKGEVVAPVDCTVNVIYPTLHAMGVTLDNGVELLIHVGIDTVKLERKYFKQYAQEGTHIKKGTKIISFDLEKIEEAGYDTTVSVVVANTFDYKEVIGLQTQHADIDTTVIEII